MIMSVYVVEKYRGCEWSPQSVTQWLSDVSVALIYKCARSYVSYLYECDSMCLQQKEKTWDNTHRHTHTPSLSLVSMEKLCQYLRVCSKCLVSECFLRVNKKQKLTVLLTGSLMKTHSTLVSVVWVCVCMCVPHLSLLVLCDQCAVEVLQSHLGHGNSLLSVITH